MDKRFAGALDTVVSELKDKSEVNGIILFGSAQSGEANETSDLDLFVVVEGSECWSARRLVEDVEVDLCFAPFDHWQKTVKSGHIASVKAFATGVVLQDRKGEIERLVDLARNVWETGPPPLDRLQVANWRIRLSDHIRDLEGLSESVMEARLLGGIIVPLAIEAYFALNRIWGEKPARVIKSLSSYDPRLASEVAKFYRNGMDLSQAIAIVDYVLEPHGGRLLTYEGPRVQC